MPAAFLHGVEVFEYNSGPAPINVVKSAVIGLVGSAPLWAIAPNAPSWQPGQAVAVGYQITDSNGNAQVCTAAGSTGSSQPVWATTLGAATADGTASWSLVALGKAEAIRPYATDRIYVVGSQALDSNGNLQQVSALTLPAWAATNVETAGNLIEDSNGNTQRVTTAGTTGSVAPTWSTTLGHTTTDGSVTWTLIALGKVGVSGATAPSWPTNLNATVSDGVITWKLIKLAPALGLLQTPTLITGQGSSGAAGQASSFGPLIQGYSIPYALAAVFAQGAGQAIVVNVFDQTKHVTAVSNQAATFPASGAQAINLGHMGVSGVVLKNSGGTVTYLQGFDFTVDHVNGVITAISTGTLSAGESVEVSYNFADPSKIADADLVGTITSGVYTGMQSWLLSYGLFGFWPKILLAPSFGAGNVQQNVGSQDATVASGMATIAEKIRAVYLVDSPPSTAIATALSNRGTAGQAFDSSDTRAVLCFPQENFFDTGIIPTGITLSTAGVAVQNKANVPGDSPYSIWVAGAIAARDLAKGYWWSPSNMPLVGVLGPDISMYASLLDAACDVNDLNAAGIVTAFNSFGTGIRVWGNRTAGFPTVTTPDQFISVRRTLDVIEESVELAMLQFIDQPISNALIDAILASVNAFLRTLIGRGALVNGKASFNPAENPANQIAAGQLVFDLDVMPPPPAERITFNVFIDTTLLAGLTGTAASASAANG